jgi:hypothetical protein
MFYVYEALSRSNNWNHQPNWGIFSIRLDNYLYKLGVTRDEENDLKDSLQI